jgi:hypothetical protein
MELNPYEPLQVKLRLERVLLENMRKQASDLRTLLEKVNGHWVYEDGLYRFYHQSFKVYNLQAYTLEMTAALAKLAPEGRPFCEYFRNILQNGTGRVFISQANERWIEETAPITLAFLHAKYFLEMAIQYSTLEDPPQPMPSGWAAVLSLFDLR